MSPRRAVFLDRDGVLNRLAVRDGKPCPPANGTEVELVPRVEEACRLLSEAGFLLIVVTNQPDVARGKSRREEVEAINDTLCRLLPIDDVRVCYHDDPQGCACRKPRPGMLLDAAVEWGLDLDASYMVGDRWRDIDAGREAGCTTVFVDHGYAESGDSRPDVTVSSLREGALWILRSAAAR